MRTLASIQKILDLSPIPGADAIEKARVLGWDVVVKKGEFKVGDLCVYFEIDSLLPPNPLWDSFLAKTKYRIKTIRLRGQLSQGLCLPVSILSKFNYSGPMKEDADVTSAIGVLKWESADDREANAKAIASSKKTNPIVKILMRFAWFRFIYSYLYGKEKGSFPAFISKTDETRIQSIKKPQLEEMIAKGLCYVTEKIDGQSGTWAIKKAFSKGFFDKLFNKHTFFVCSREQWKKYADASNWWIIAKQEQILEKLMAAKKEMGIEIAIQGEVYGGKIQGNKYGVNGMKLAVFNVKDITNGKYFTLDEMKDFCKKYGFETVPILDESFDLTGKTVDDIVEYAKGKSVLADVLREGVVIRSKMDVTLSFKAINNDFLEKY